VFVFFSSAFTMENSYSKVLVVGSRKVGKTSILSASLNGDFTETYAPTGFRIEKYYDVERGIEFMDTPGIDGDCLKLHNLSKFLQDPIIQEYTGKQVKDKRELLRDFDFSSLKAYVIVFAQSLHSRKMAYALHEAIREHNRKIQIIMVENRGDIPPSQEDIDLDKFWKAHDIVAAEKDGNQDATSWRKYEERIFDEDCPKLKHERADETKSVWVCAQTFEGLDKLMDQIGQQDNRQARRSHFKRAGGSRQCEPRNCVEA